MKLQVNIMTICDYSLVSKDNKLSIIGIFDELRVLKFPGVLAKGFLVANVTGTPNTAYSLKLEVGNDQHKNILPPLDLAINMGANGSSNIVLELVGAQFPGEGKYNFKMYSGEEEIGSTYLKVIHIKQNEKSNPIRSN